MQLRFQVFRRWDGEAALLQNNLLAQKVIRNQWRSGSLLHNCLIAVSADTARDKLEQMKKGIAAALRVSKEFLFSFWLLARSFAFCMLGSCTDSMHALGKFVRQEDRV